MKTWSCLREQTRITWECLFIWIAFYRTFPSVHRLHWEVKWRTCRRQRPASSHPRSCFHFQKGTSCLLQNSVESFFYKQIEMSSSRSYRQNERNCVGRGKRVEGGHGLPELRHLRSLPWKGLMQAVCHSSKLHEQQRERRFMTPNVATLLLNASV